MNTLSLGPPGAAYTDSQSWYNTLGELVGQALWPGPKHDFANCRVGRALNWSNATIIQRLLYDDFHVQLPDAYLTKVNVAAMAASLEVRAPLLDVEVLETAWRIPDRMKLHWGKRKWILKHIAVHLVLPEVIYRPKMGFAIPLRRWFQGEIGFALEDLLKDSVAEKEGYINSKRVLRELEDHRHGSCDSHTRLWLILWFELWCRVVLTGEMSQSTNLSDLLG